MLYNGSKTIYNTKLQNCLLTGLPYEPIIGTTINEKYNIMTVYDKSLVDTYPKLNLIVIGASTIEANGDLTKLNLYGSGHSPIETELKNHIPLYLRTTEEAIVNPPSNKYRLKTTLIIAGIEYIAYYGYTAIDFNNKKEIVMFNNIEDEYVSVSKLDTDIADILNPPVGSTTDLTKTSGITYIGDFVKIHLFFTLNELLEIKNVLNILYPDGDHYINEIAVCHSKELNTGIIIENVETQISYFLDIDRKLDDAITNGKLDFYVEVGGMEVLRR